MLLVVIVVEVPVALADPTTVPLIRKLTVAPTVVPRDDKSHRAGTRYVVGGARTSVAGGL